MPRICFDVLRILYDTEVTLATIYRILQLLWRLAFCDTWISTYKTKIQLTTTHIAASSAKKDAWAWRNTYVTAWYHGYTVLRSPKIRAATTRLAQTAATEQRLYAVGITYIKLQPKFQTSLVMNDGKHKLHHSNSSRKMS